MNRYIIDPALDGEARIRIGEDTIPVGIPFEHDRTLAELKELLPNREIKTVAAKDAVGAPVIHSDGKE